MTIRDFGTLARLWYDLEAAGIPLEPLEKRVGIDTRNRGSALTIRAGRDRWRSVIRELRNGLFAYILPVFVRRDRPGKTIIRDSWISPPWMDTEIELLGDPKEEGRHPDWYTFPGDTEHFFREKVVNHRVNCNLFHGDIREGFLLAVEVRPPETCKDHDVITVTYTVLEQWDCEHSAKMQMRMNRRPTRVETSPESKRGDLNSRLESRHRGLRE